MVNITNNRAVLGIWDTKGTASGVGMGAGNPVNTERRSPEEVKEYEKDKPYTFTRRRSSWLDGIRNCAVLVPGMRINNFTGAGFLFAVTEDSVRVSNRNMPREEVQRTARGLDYLVRLANGQFTVDTEIQAAEFFECGKMNAAVIKALEAMGVDINRPFYINGAAFEVAGGFIVPHDEPEPASLAEEIALARESHKDSYTMLMEKHISSRGIDEWLQMEV